MDTNIFFFCFRAEEDECGVENDIKKNIQLCIYHIKSKRKTIKGISNSNELYYVINTDDVETYDGGGRREAKLN